MPGNWTSVSWPVGDERPAEHLGPEPLLRLDVLDGYVHVAERHTQVVGGGQLRQRRSRPREHRDRDGRKNLSHRYPPREGPIFRAVPAPVKGKPWDPN